MRFIESPSPAGSTAGKAPCGQFPAATKLNAGMNETPPTELTPGQIAVLERLLAAGFQFVAIEHVVRYLPVEKNGFVALLDPSGGRFQIFGEAGYRIGEGVGILIEKEGAKKFVWKNQSVEATGALLDSFGRFKKELSELLQASAQ